MPPQQQLATDTTDTRLSNKFRVEYSSTRDDHPKSAEQWLDGKRLHDDAEGLWRLHDKLYDLTEFMDRHPGGRYWLEALRGTDITEAFESHHLNPSVVNLLPKFYVRDAMGRKNSPYTFHEDGFYKTLKRKAWPVIKREGSGPTLRMRLMTDSIASLFLALLIIAGLYRSYAVAVAAGVALAWTMGIAHNFFHQANNWRMFYFDLSCFSSCDWRITHAVSHHLYTNTFYDWEISALEPFAYFLPDPKKHWIARYLSPVSFHIMLFLGFFIQFLNRCATVAGDRKLLHLENLLVVGELIALMVSSGSLTTGFGLWATMVCTSCFCFSYVGILGTHHHPETYHQHDALRDEPDWGLCQMDAVRDKVEVTGSLFLVSIAFGDHTLHHLFPTVDHSKLPLLYPAFLETCKQFDQNYTFLRLGYLWKGLYTQMLSCEPNKKKPGYPKKREVLLAPSVIEEIAKAKKFKTS